MSKFGRLYQVGLYRGIAEPRDKEVLWFHYVLEDLLVWSERKLSWVSILSNGDTSNFSKKFIDFDYSTSINVNYKDIGGEMPFSVKVLGDCGDYYMELSRSQYDIKYPKNLSQLTIEFTLPTKGQIIIYY